MPSKARVIWITGASSGIGAELARQMAGPNVQLVLTSRNEKDLEAVAEACQQQGAEVRVLPADLVVPTELEQIVKAAIAAFGRVDVVVHSAGVSQRSLAEATDPDVDRQLMELDFFAPTRITRMLLSQFRVQKQGMVVAIGSVAGVMGFPLRSGYCAAKHALKGWFEALQVEHDIPGFHVLIVHPGRIRTNISEHALTANGEAHGEMDPGQQNGMPVDQCARKIIRAMERRKHQVMIGSKERMLWRIWWFLPSIYRKLARSQGGK